MTDWEVLVNPAAGKRPPDLERIRTALAGAGVDHHLTVTVSPSDLAGRAVTLAGAGNPLALVGGDGTVSLVVDALIKAGLESPLIGMIPAGSGCDLFRTFGIPPTIEAAVSHLGRPGEYQVDVGRLEGTFGVRHFINVAQTGVGAAAAETAVRLPRGLGRIRYPMAFAARLPGFPRCHVTITGSRTWQGDALAVILANAQFFAGGWNVAPKALMEDGELDVQMICSTKGEAPSLVPKIIKGVHLSHSSVTRRSLAAFDITTDVEWPVEVDGDFVGHTPLSVSVLPRRVRLKI